MIRKLALALLLFSSSAFAANVYVWCGVVGGLANGSNFTNALSDLPATGTEVRGNTYVIAGDNTCIYPPHTFNAAVSGTTLINYRRAKASLDSGITGWGSLPDQTTNAAIWQDTTQVDPTTSTGCIWNIASSYQTWEGFYGTWGPSSVSGFGMIVQSENPIKSGNALICLDSTNSSGTGDLTNITLNWVGWRGTGRMVGGWQHRVSACSYDGVSLTTFTTDTPINVGITGDKFDGATLAIIFSNVTSTSVSGSTVVLNTGATNQCTNMTIGASWLALSGFPMAGFYTRQASSGTYLNANTYHNITVTNSFSGYMSENRIDNCYNCNFLGGTHGPTYTTPQQHGSVWQHGEFADLTIAGPWYFSNMYIMNVTGTGIFEHLGHPSSCTHPNACGYGNGIYITGNVMHCPLALPYKCGTGHYTASDNAGQTCVNNAVVANNTSIGISGGMYYLTNNNTTCSLWPSTPLNQSYNNLYYNVSQVENRATHQHNIMLNGTSSGGTTWGPTELKVLSGAADPFVNSAAFNYALASDTGAVPSPCVSGTNCFKDGINTTTLATNPVAGNATDMNGVSRGTGNGWDVGAFQLFAGASNYTVTAACAGNANGTIIGSAGSVMNGVCTTGVCTGTCSESITAGATVTYTATATTGSLAGFTGGICNGSPCSPTINAPLTLIATFQNSVTCGLTFATNSLNAPSLASATTTFTGLSGPNSLWFIFGPPPNNTVIYSCPYPFLNCNANGQTGNIIPVGSGQYTAGACSNGSCCSGGSTAPLNVNNISISGIAQ